MEGTMIYLEQNINKTYFGIEEIKKALDNAKIDWSYIGCVRYFEEEVEVHYTTPNQDKECITFKEA